MTPEQRRLAQLRRMASLFITATLRARRERREQDDRITILIGLFEKNEKRFAKNEKRFAKNEERFAKNEERFAKNEERLTRIEQAIDRLIAAQTRTDEKLQALIDAIRGRNPGELLT